MDAPGAPVDTGPAPERAIEVGFPVREVNRLAATEAYNKHHYRPTNYGHKWWARRLGSVFRTACLAALLPADTSPAEVWDRFAEPNDLRASRDDGSSDDDGPGAGPLVLDPFMGGGTTGQEATRLGGRFLGCDINPVAWFVARTGLAPPPDEAALDAAFERVRDRARPEIEPHYRTRCPDCDAAVGASFYLWVALDTDGPDAPARVYDSLVVDRGGDGATTVVCPVCHDPTVVADPEHATCACGETFDATREDVRVPVADPTPPLGGEGRPAYEPYAVKYDCPDCGAGFAAFDAFDRDRLRAARERFADRRDDLLLPTQRIPPGGEKTRDLRNRGYERWTELFSARQLLALGSLFAAAADVEDDRCRHYLLRTCSAALEFNSIFCSYKGDDPCGPGAVRHLFSHHAFVHSGEPLENNPLGTRPRQSGTVPYLYEYRLRRALAFQREPVERVLGPDGSVAGKRAVPGERVGGEPAASVDALLAGEGRHYCHCGDAADLPFGDRLAGRVDAVVTDPPYFDSVQYGELSDLFYVWLGRALRPEYPDVFAADSVVSDAEAVGNASRERSLDDYRRLLRAVFASAGRAATDDAPLVFTFHHGEPAPWGAVLEAVEGAGWQVVAAYPVRGENRRSVHIHGQRAVLLDSLVVCRRAGARPAGDWATVRECVVRAARERLRTYDDGEGGDLSRLDASVVVRGACLAAHSAFGTVTDADGPVGPREAMARLEPLVDELNTERF